EVVGRMLNFTAEQRHIRGLPKDVGPGNALTITIESTNVTEVFTGFGERAVSAEHVARHASAEAREYLDSEGAVGPHLADQLLLPMALAGRGEFTTYNLTQHFHSAAAVIERFLGVAVKATGRDGIVAVYVG